MHAIMLQRYWNKKTFEFVAKNSIPLDNFITV